MAHHDVKKAKEIGARIKTARLEMGGMSQRELGDMLGVTERSIQAYEQGEVVPYRFGAALESALGRPVAWFWYGDEALRDASAGKLDEVLAELKALRKDLAKLKRAVEASAPAAR